MHFRITGLSAKPFSHLYGLGDEELARHGAIRMIADACPGFPDRIELRDAEPGESLLLVNFVHHPADNPFRASHAIFVREGAEDPFDAIDEIPPVMRTRLISLRAFDSRDMMIDAEIAKGDDLVPAIRRLLDAPGTAFLHAHYATRGCYAARIERASP